MSRESARRHSGNRLQKRLVALIVAVVSLPVLSAAAAPDDSERKSVSIHMQGGRDQPARISESAEDYGKLVTEGERSKSNTRGAFAKPGSMSAQAESLNQDFWIYDADVQLYNDDDGDGYFHGIDLLFDADTIYAEADVYAVMYLSLDGGPWNEYAASEDFTIFGATSDDEYVLLTELMSGYPSGSYDILIELFDAFDGTFLASLGPAEDSSLGYLPLEDFNRDAPVQDVIVVTSYGGGGAVDGFTISLLALLAFASLLRHRRLAMTRGRTQAVTARARRGVPRA